MNEQALLEAINQTMPFGKYARREVREIPASYRDWMLTNFNWTPFNKKIKDEILRLKSIGI